MWHEGVFAVVTLLVVIPGWMSGSVLCVVFVNFGVHILFWFLSSIVFDVSEARTLGSDCVLPRGILAFGYGSRAGTPCDVFPARCPPSSRSKDSKDAGTGTQGTLLRSSSPAAQWTVREPYVLQGSLMARPSRSLLLKLNQSSSFLVTVRPR